MNCCCCGHVCCLQGMFVHDIRCLHQDANLFYLYIFIYANLFIGVRMVPSCFTTYSAGNLPDTNWQASGPSKLCSDSKSGAKQVLCISRICCIDPFIPPTGVKHLGDSLVHTSPGNCIAVFNSSASVKHLFTAFNSKWTKCHLSVYINSSLVVKIIQILSVNKSRAEEILMIEWKMFTHLIS